MSEVDYQNILKCLNLAEDIGALTPSQYEAALLALDRAVETEHMYEGLCK